MTCAIIGCGESAQHAKLFDYSIGVNDCWKYGLITDRLIVVNNLSPWPDRDKQVMASTPKDGILSHIQRYAGHPNYKYIGSMVRWKGKFAAGSLYKSQTSPFIAISMAHNMGFSNIVLYGVDFVSHRTVKGNSLKSEARQYDSFCSALRKIGTNVYLGINYGALNQILPIWNH